jgi:hypothetical protein
MNTLSTKRRASTGAKIIYMDIYDIIAGSAGGGGLEGIWEYIIMVIVIDYVY